MCWKLLFWHKKRARKFFSQSFDECTCRVQWCKCSSFFCKQPRQKFEGWYCCVFSGIHLSVWTNLVLSRQLILVWNLLQRVAVLHLEERCERAIEWALKIEPSIRHLVKWAAKLLLFHSHYSQFMLHLHFLASELYTLLEWEIHLVFCLWQVVSGGVASNKYVRAQLTAVVRKKGLQLVCPPPSLCTDNGIIHVHVAFCSTWG